MIKKLLATTTLLLLLPIEVGAIDNAKPKKPNFKTLEEKAIIECDRYGHESCAGRFLAMGGCAYAMGLRSNKEPLEARDIGDSLFMAMMKANKIPPKVLWDENNKIKKNIKREAIDRMRFCKSIIKEVAIKLYKEKSGKELVGEALESAISAFSWVYVHDIEKVWEEK